MTAPESFVSRWARLKRGPDSDRTRTPAGETTATGRAGAVVQPEIAAAAEVPFDPASLPSIDAIGFDTDIRGFLQSRVPAELTRAALRQAWASDPAIRDFIGIAENQWDFNGVDTIPGFGPLPEGFDVSGLLQQVLDGRDRPVEKTPQTAEAVERLSSAATHPEPADPGIDRPQSSDAEFGNLSNDRSRESAAPEKDHAAEADDRSQNQRRHGSALPRQDG